MGKRQRGGRLPRGLVEERPWRVCVRCPQCVAIVGRSLVIMEEVRPGMLIQLLLSAVVRVGMGGEPIAAWNQCEVRGGVEELHGCKCRKGAGVSGSERREWDGPHTSLIVARGSKDLDAILGDREQRLIATVA